MSTVDDLTPLGVGPAATCDEGGWRMGDEFVFECTACGGRLSGDPHASGRCPCGAMSKDPDAGRVGSRLGDDAIAVYRSSSTARPVDDGARATDRIAAPRQATVLATTAPAGGDVDEHRGTR